MKRIILATVFALYATIAAAETCFFEYEQESGLNKICVYSCPSGNAAITVKSYQLCPITIRR